MLPVDRRRGEAAAADRMRGWRLARVALLPKSVKRIPVLTLDRRPVGNLVLGEAENQGLRPHPMESPRSVGRSEEHTSELQSLMRISYAVFCLQKKKKYIHTHYTY